MTAIAYDRNNQIDLQTLTLQKPGSDEILDITPVMEQFIIFEDLFQSAISARLIIRDQVNLVGSHPIVGGETIQIKFKTTGREEIIDLSFVVYAIGERDLGTGQDNIQMNQLMLCTPEVWWAANNDTESAFKGTYTEIITKILSETGTKKAFTNKEDSVGLVDYVAPSLNPFSAIKFCASRANSADLSPMFFWETTQGYNMKSLKTLYKTQWEKQLFIQDRSIDLSEEDRAFNTIYSFDYLESNNRLQQYSRMAFGADYMSVDFVNKRVLRTSNSYEKMFKEQGIGLAGFALNDDAKSIRNIDTYSPYRQDLSHLSEFNRNSALALMDNLKLMINIPGDSKLKTGDIIYLDIPSKVGLDIMAEGVSSGKWLVRSIKHLVTKTTYSMVCEITKDSFESETRPQAS